MFVAYGNAQLYLPYCSSLKEKRRVIHGLISRVRKRFSISISEVSYHDLWQRSVIGFAAVSGKNDELQFLINIINETFYNYSSDLEVIDFNYEIINMLIP